MILLDEDYAEICGDGAMAGGSLKSVCLERASEERMFKLSAE